MPPILSVHRTVRRTPRREVARLAEALRRRPHLADDPAAATATLEEQIATTVGKPAALFLPTGKMAQQIALRIHADRRPGRRTILAHPANHLTLWEDDTFPLVHGLHVRRAGDPYELLTTADLHRELGEGVAAVLWELPQRELGGELPAWDDLEAQLAATRFRGAATHLDGARLWQTSTAFARPLSEICAGFDSVYVSLYKDLEAPHGAVLAGDLEFIAAARQWRRRLGGTIDDAWSVALLALDGLVRVAARMDDYVVRTREIAAAIVAGSRATVRPNPPQVALCHVHLPVGVAAARRAQDHLVRESGPQLTLRFRTGPDRDRCSFELTVGEAVMDLSPERIATSVAQLLQLARESEAP